jgi:hypothetical protein
VKSKPSFALLQKLTFLALALMLSPHSFGQATFTSWTPIYQGVDYATGTVTGSTQQLYAMRIDLTAAGISFTTTPSSASAVSQGYETYSQTTGAFLTSVGASVAINANFFSNVQSTSVPENLSGLAVSQGAVVATADSNYQTLFLTADNVATIGSASSTSVYNAVSGVQTLQNGVPINPPTTAAGDPQGLDPRTAVGVSQDGRYLYLFAADGRSTQSAGITDLTEGQILLQLGAYNGLNLDGGGSTSLVRSNGAGGATVLNIPSGGSQRLDGNNLAVFARPVPVTTPPVTYTQAVLNLNPVLYFQLNETSGSTAVDSSSTGDNGTYPASGITLGNANTPITSQAGTTISANGAVGSKVVIPYNSVMSAGSFTVAAWAYPTNSASVFQAVVSQRNDKGSGAAGNSGFILYDGPATGATGNVWQFWTGGNTSLTYNYEGRGTNGEGVGPTVALNQWSFVVGTFNVTGGPDANGRYTGTQSLYVNGTLALTLSNVLYLPNQVRSLYIGAGANEATTDQFQFTGGIAHVALFNTALSQSQISALYTASRPPQAPVQAGAINTVWYIDMENRNFTNGGDSTAPSQVLGNSAAPYINSLITSGSGNPATPMVSYCTSYHNALATPSGSNASIHPSEPNYVWQEAGSNLGLTNDNDPYGTGCSIAAISSYLASNPSVGGQNLCSLLQSAGFSWKTYQEGIDLQTTTGTNVNLGGTPTNTVISSSSWTVPLSSFSISDDSSYTNPYNGSHYLSFACKHCGPLFFTATNGSTSSAANTSTSNLEVSHYAPLEQLQTDLTNGTCAQYNLITPDLYNDMHTALPTGFTYKGTPYTGDLAQVAQGDNFLSIIIPRIMASPQFKNNGAIVIWFDETEGTNQNDFTHTMTEIVISPLAKGNAYASAYNYTHSSDLATMQKLFGVKATTASGFLNDAANPSNASANGGGQAQDLSDLFVPGAVAPGSGSSVAGGSAINVDLSTDGSSGQAGTAWSNLAVNGTLDFSGASAANPVVINLVTLSNSSQGTLGSFDPTSNHIWTGFITAAGGITGFNPQAFTFNPAGFANAFSGTFSVQEEANGTALDLVYTAPSQVPVPRWVLFTMAPMLLLLATRFLPRKQELN